MSLEPQVKQGTPTRQIAMSSRKGGSAGAASKDPNQKTLQESFSGLSQKKPPTGAIQKKESQKRTISDIMGNESAANKRQSSDSAKSIDDSIATAYEQNIGNSAAACASPHQSQSQLSQESQGGVKKRKTVHDVMYQQMDFHPLLVAVMDTKHFQRLRKLKQLGTTEYVFPSATHTRFEHSLGVGDRASKFVRLLREKQTDLGINDVDIICVALAGMAHDMGHGPFSHQFELFLKKVITTMEDGEIKRQLKSWSHEEMSCKMFDHAIRTANIDYTIPEYGNLTKNDIHFIKELIMGKENVREGDPGEKREYKMRTGRPASKSFLYDIVNNVDSGFDVDKLDYLQRDQECTLGDKINCFERLSAMGRVCTVQGLQDWHNDERSDLNTRKAICFPEKSAQEALAVFQTRYQLHNKVYQHRRVMAMDEMIADILFYANEAVTIKIDGSDRRSTIAECALSCEAFCNLNDTITEIIKNTDPSTLSPRKASSLRKAQDLLDRLERRELYVSVGDTNVDRFGEHADVWSMNTADLAKAIVKGYNEAISISGQSSQRGESFVEDSCGEEDNENVSLSQIIKSRRSVSKESLTDDCLCVLKWHIHYGSNEKNPVNKMYFFYKGDDTKPEFMSGEVPAHQIDEEKLHGIPRKFEACQLRVLCKDRAQAAAAKIAVRMYFQEHKCRSPIGQSSQDLDDYTGFSQRMSQDY